MVTHSLFFPDYVCTRCGKDCKTMTYGDVKKEECPGYPKKFVQTPAPFPLPGMDPVYVEYLKRDKKEHHIWKLGAHGQIRCVKCGVLHDVWALDSYPKCLRSEVENAKKEHLMKNELHHEWIGGIFSGYVCRRCGQKRSAASIGVCPGFVDEYSSEGYQTIGAIKATNGRSHSFAVGSDRSVKCFYCGMPFDHQPDDGNCPGRKPGDEETPKVKLDPLKGFSISSPYNVLGAGDKLGKTVIVDRTPISDEEMRRIRNSALDLAVRSIPAMQPPSSNLGMRIEAHNPTYILSVAKTFEAYLKDGTLPGKDTPPEENSK